MIAFDRDSYLALFAAYNGDIWPWPLLGLAMALLPLAAMRWRWPQRDRVVAVALVAMWAWTAAVYHWTYFASINFTAPVLAGAFALQALLLAWTGVVRGRLRVAWHGNLASWAGAVLMIFAVVGYPAWCWLDGHAWPRVALAGSAPTPTVLLTLGALIAARAPWHLFAIPLLWAAVASLAAWELDLPPDLSLVAAGLAAALVRALPVHASR